MKKHLQLCLLFLICSLSLLYAQETNPPSSAAGTSNADNTGVNKRDRNSTEPTADQQKENKSDRELAREVRRALVKDKSISTYAHNVKVVAQGGTVTLKGPVHSEQEKQAVESKAAQAAGGSDRVKSEIEISGDSKKPTAAKPDNQ